MIWYYGRWRGIALPSRKELLTAMYNIIYCRELYTISLHGNGRCGGDEDFARLTDVRSKGRSHNSRLRHYYLESPTSLEHVAYALQVVCHVVACMDVICSSSSLEQPQPNQDAVIFVHVSPSEITA